MDVVYVEPFKVLFRDAEQLIIKYFVKFHKTWKNHANDLVCITSVHIIIVIGNYIDGVSSIVFDIN